VERLADLDEFTLRCRTAEAREHIAEAVACYRGGAFRATVVMSWVAVVFDLIDKVRELAIAGEAAAVAMMHTFDAYQEQIHANSPQATKQALEFERTILSKVSADLSLLDALQLSDLERLREDRHRSAHPSFNRAGEAFRPTAELARLHLRNAIAHVLSQPPRQGRAALATLHSLVASEYFPTDPTRARTQLEGGGLAHASDALVRSLVDLLIFGYVDADGDLHASPGTLAALVATLDVHRGVAEPQAAMQTRRVVRTATDDGLPAAVAFVAAWPDAWAHLDPVERERIAAFVAAGGWDVLGPSVPGLSRAPELQVPLQERLRGLDTPKLVALMEEEGMPMFVADAAIARYLASNSYNDARIRRRRLISPLVEHLSAGQVAAIVAGAGVNDQVRGENYFPPLLARLRASEVMAVPEFDAIARAAGLGDMLDGDGEEG
jgi:hypothetical protein